MSKLASIPEELVDRTEATLIMFGCGRWKAAITYASALIKGSDAFDPTYKEDHLRQLGEKVLQILQTDGRILTKMYADERIVYVPGREDASRDNLNAFEAFAALVDEVAEAEQYPEFCYVRKTSDYPFHYVFASSMQMLLYRVLVYGQDSFVRLGYFNEGYNDKRDNHFVTLLVVPDSIPWEEFEGVFVKGKTRIAFIKEDNSKNKSYQCLLTDIIEEA